MLTLDQVDKLGVRLSIASRCLGRNVGITVSCITTSVEEPVSRLFFKGIGSRIVIVTDVHPECAVVVTAHQEAILAGCRCPEVALESREPELVAQSLRMVDRRPVFRRKEVFGIELSTPVAVVSVPA